MGRKKSEETALKLTDEQKDALIVMYEEPVKKAARRFAKSMVKCSATVEDLEQICYIAILKKASDYARKQPHPDRADFSLLPSLALDMKHAMCELVLKSLPMGDRVSTGTYTETLRNAPVISSIDEHDFISPKIKDFSEDVCDVMAFRQWVETLSLQEQKIVVGKLSGKTNTVIARYLGLSDPTMTRTLRKLAASYREFMDGV